ncbi:MAG: TlpA disulfide reductase family protein [Bacteroidota bacterium]
MRSKQLLPLFIALSTLAACSSSDRKFTVMGNITGMPPQTVILEQLNANDIITIVDSQKSAADGHFEVSAVAPEAGLYRLHFGDNKFILLSVDKGNMEVTGNWQAIENYTVNGSIPSKQLQTFIVSIREHLRDFNTMSVVLDTLQAKGSDSMLAVAKTDFDDMKTRFTQFVERYADTTKYAPNAVFAARILNPYSESAYLSSFTAGLPKRFPKMKLVKDFEEYYNKILAKQRAGKPQQSVEPGSMAPDISLPTAEGQTITLSSLRGKYVLVDFWASWCGPCRGENPTVVAAWERFKEKNFAILGVSLDNNKDAWQKAVKDDNLAWTQVSDLKGWSSAAAATYAIQSIPANFLIDPQGKIVGRNLRGSQLEETLQEVLK